MWFFVYLNYANHRLAINLWIIVNDYIETIVNCHDPCRFQSSVTILSILFKRDVICCRDCFFLLKFLAIFLESHFVRVGVSNIASTLFDRGFNCLTYACCVINKSLNQLTFFECKSFWELDRYWFIVCGWLFEKELPVETWSSLLFAKNVVDCFFCFCNLLIKLVSRIINHEPSMMSHVSFSQPFINDSCFICSIISSLVCHCFIEAFCAISSCYHMNHCIISVFSQINCAWTQFIN